MNTTQETTEKKKEDAVLAESSASNQSVPIQEKVASLGKKKGGAPIQGGGRKKTVEDFLADDVLRDHEDLNRGAKVNGHGLNLTSGSSMCDGLLELLPADAGSTSVSPWLLETEKVPSAWE